MTVERYIIYFEGDEASERGHRDGYVSSLLDKGYFYVPESNNQIKKIYPAVAKGEVAWEIAGTVLSAGLVPLWVRSLHRRDDMLPRLSDANANFIHAEGIQWARDSQDSSNSIVIGTSEEPLYVGSVEFNPAQMSTLSISLKGSRGTAREGWGRTTHKDLYLISGCIKNKGDYDKEKEGPRLQNA